MEQKKKKPQMAASKKWILLVDGVLVVGLVVAVVLLFTKLGGRKTSAVDASNKPAVQQQSQQQTSDDVAQSEALPAPAESPYAAALYLTADGVPERVDFDALRAQGVDAAAWLYCPDSPISYPVMHALDNEYYMDRNELGKRDKSGAVSLDCRNSATLDEAQIMLYGNAMEDGSMFGSLASYRDAAYFAAHPFLYLCTPEKIYRIEVFAANTASPAMANYPTWFETDAARATYLKSVADKSFLASNLAIASDAKLVSVVTNSDFEAGEDARFVVHGILSEQ